MIQITFFSFYLTHADRIPLSPAMTTMMTASTMSSNGLYDARATIIIIGMKGAGKTTIGLMANRSMGRTFIDMDYRFRMSENTSVEAYVAAHGWNAFRARETALLKELLVQHPFDAVIACGGGIIESSESRRVLKSVLHTMPVIRVLREESAIRQYIDGRWLKQYDEDLDAMMRRRSLLYRECCSHTFYNLSCDSDASAKEPSRSIDRANLLSSSTNISDPLKFKQVGNSFERLLRAILGESFKSANHSQNFADPELGANSILARPSRQSSAPLDLPGSPTSGHNTPPVFRNSLSNLLAPHGPGPGPLHEPAYNEYKVSSPSHNGSKVHPKRATNGNPSARGKVIAVLPRKANVLERSSLLTRRTTAMSLTFADLTSISANMIRNITQGVDALELRVDMLDCLRPATATARSLDIEAEPKIDFEEVARQLETLRKLTPDIPILFTLRSDREGGFFHDDRKLSQRDTRSPHSQTIYFRLLSLAIGMGIEMLDVELGWDPRMTKRLIESRGRTKIVPSYHDLMGALKWDTNVARQLYDRACSFGNGVHVVMMIGTTTRSNIEQNQHLGSFSARLLSTAGADPSARMPPLMALNMGMAGRSSRPFNDVLNFVSHPAMPMKAGKGQLSLKEMMETLVRLSVIRSSHFHLYGAVHEAAQLVKEAIIAAFDEFGLPYQLLEEGTWSLAEYVDVHQNDEAGEREEEEKTMINSMSDGLFIADHAHRQVELFEIMSKTCPERISTVGKIVQAVDVMARQDIGLLMLGTERGRRVPNALGEMRGPLVGCHTLPAAIERILLAHLAPINVPNAHRSGLIVILNDEEESTEKGNMDVDEDMEKYQATSKIAKRAALYALSKMGLGTVYILEQSDSGHANLSDDPPYSRRQSLAPGASRDSSAPPQASTSKVWAQEVLRLSNDEESQSGTSGDASDQIRVVVRDISLASLAHSPTRSGHDTPESSLGKSARMTSLPDLQHNQDDEDAETMAAIYDFERHPSKRPCAIVIVGGNEERQQECLSTLTNSSSHVQKTSDEDQSRVTQNKKRFVLPQELWQSSFGGTIVRIPSKRSDIIGSRTKIESDAPKVNGNLHFQDDQTATLHNGWINVEPWVIERDRVQKNVIEAWTRRSAPNHHLCGIWDAK